MIYFAAGVILAYLIGAIPFGWLAGKILKGVDIREHGSGNIGATNAGRVLGKRIGLTVLFLDAFKGFAPVYFIPMIPQFYAITGTAWTFFAPALGLATILGHNWPVYIGFKGGKGMSTSLGVLLALSPTVVGCGAATFLLVVLITRWVSLASIAACPVAITAAWYLHPNLIPINSLITLMGLLAIIRHHRNIVRLIKGTEPKFDFAAKRAEGKDNG
ncbi:MAG: glycerol-3-phosphate 1-O-acyltransferase PlsY [Candidatus Brocadiia bacterium]